MDVSFTNVLEGARQYFQGLPVPSTAGTTASTENISTSSTSSNYGATATSVATANGNRYTDTRPEESSSNSYWNPPGPNELRPVEPYPPQPTRVEVPDTRPHDRATTETEYSSSTSNVTLTEMQPSKSQNSERPCSPQLHQMQPPKPHSPAPVYQQLNSVSRTPYSASEVLNTHSTYQPAERPAASAPVVQRTQYYPRYHHPDITKSAPVPFTQSTAYQQPANTSTVPSPSLRPSSSEQVSQTTHCPEQRVPNTSYANPQSARGYGSSTAPAPSYGGQRSVLHPADGGGNALNSSSAAPSSVSPRQNHIPPAQNPPAHIPSPHLPSGSLTTGHTVSPRTHAANPNPYSRSVFPHASNSVAGAQQMLPPPPGNNYHEATSRQTTPSPQRQSPHVSLHPSPHHTPSPHSANFQPHSPTYPPPPLPTRSTPHSYNLPTSQYQTVANYPNSYHPTSVPPQHSYHSYQKTAHPAQTSYYSQPRSQQYVQPPMNAPPISSVNSNNTSSYQQIRPVTYNGADKRSPMEAVASYGSYRPQSMPRSGNTHNLPPIAALSSYHSNRSSRESLSKSQTVPRARTHHSPVGSKPPPASSMIAPPRVPDYPSVIHSSSTNGRTASTLPNSTYGRYASQSYPYATTIAPSHGSNSTTTVTSIGVPVRSSLPPVYTTYSSSEAANRTGPYQMPREGENFGYKDYPYSTTTATSSPALTNGVSIRKRESPLDLSVKTVKTPADSTAQDDLDAADKHVSSSSRSRTMLPPPAQQPAIPVNYPTFDARNTNGIRNSASSNIRVSTPQTVCAPKVDFLPDFNSGPLRHHPGSSTNESSHGTTSSSSSGSMQQIYTPPQHANNMPLPHMGVFKKKASMMSGYDEKSAAPSYDTSGKAARYPAVESSRTPSTLPVQDYPPSDPTKYYLDNSNKFSQPSNRVPTKRPAEPIYGAGGPSKQPKVDAWRIAIDKQIQQRLATAKALHEQQKRQEMNLPVALPNGTLVSPNARYEPRPDNTHQSPSRYQVPPYCDKRSYPDSKVHTVPPKPTNVHTSALPSMSQVPHNNYRQRLPFTGQPNEPPSNTGADKRVLSLLRNSLENKQQREEQLHGQQPILVNHSQQSFQNKVVAPVEPKTNIGRHNLSPFTAASLLERNSNTPPHYKFHVPKAVDSITQDVPRSMYGSKVNSSATLPGKEALLGPRGVENQIHRDKDDGLAAILAAKIRTKAELKQVGTGFLSKPPTIAPQHPVSATPKDLDAASTSTPQSGSSAGSPPKLTREKIACLPPRRRLFSRTDEENMPISATVPPGPGTGTAAASVASTMRSSGFRSSSETSVFDFRDSDSEGEMPVLERQTLEEMRRDRKQLSKVQPPVPLNDAVMASTVDLVKIELKENDKVNEIDPFWAAACDKFMEQLRSGDVLKKRGRKKKTDPVPSKNEEELTPIKPEDIKKEIPEAESKTEDCETKAEEVNPAEIDIKIEQIEKNSGDDSDEVPLIKRSAKKKSVKKEESDAEDEIICRKRRIRGSRIKLDSSSGSDSSSEESDASTEFGHGSTVADRLRARKRNTSALNEGMKLRSRDMTTPQKGKQEGKSSKSSQKGKPKPLFGDGSDFRPGWEEEVYVYKKSLRMPTRLITVSKPSRFHRLSTSLPDLDPGSPALSVSMDSSDVCLSRKRLDSDAESNYSFSTAGLGSSKIDDEEATSSTTISCPSKSTRQSAKSEHSIVDFLAQKVGTSKKDSKKKQKEKVDKAGAKIPQKGNNEPELLPTPSLASLVTENLTKTKGKTPVKSNKSLTKPIKVTDSFLLGYFRKETVNNFRDTFKNNHVLPNEFSTVVLKSRTRTETRVLKKQATIREVFGEDRPASAPPIQNHGDTSQDDDSQAETKDSAAKNRTLKQKVVSRLRNAGILRSHKAILNSKRHLIIAKRRKDLLKTLTEKKFKRIKKEKEEDEEDEEDDAQEENNDVQDNDDNQEEDNNDETPHKRKLKLRTGRRKFRSGFDYIRKKKKPLKKDEGLPKEKKRNVLSRPSPECVADIQSEIRTWVIKKGVGETILHRAARLGYTDVTAYCLEKLNSAPSPKDNAGYTPLHEACSRGHLEIAKLLLAYGANASESANGGIRPLHEAAENGATELVRLLLSYGADPLLATYSGQTPLMLAVDTDAYSILEQHLDDIQGRSTIPWSFAGPSSIFDSEDTGYNPLDDPPLDSPESELEEVDMEVSDVSLPVLFSLTNEPDKWVLLQDLMAALKVKSRDALLRQVNPKAPTGPPAIAHRDVMKELKLPDFLEQSRCCHLLSAGEKVNVRGSKVTLIKYNDKVKSLLNVERVVISLR